MIHIEGVGLQELRPVLEVESPMSFEEGGGGGSVSAGLCLQYDIVRVWSGDLWCMLTVVPFPCRMYGLFQTVFYFSYMGLGSVALGILCGELPGAGECCSGDFVW